MIGNRLLLFLVFIASFIRLKIVFELIILIVVPGFGLLLFRRWIILLKWVREHNSRVSAFLSFRLFFDVGRQQVIVAIISFRSDLRVFCDGLP